MPYKDKAKRLECVRNYRKNNLPLYAERQKKYYDKNPETYLYLFAKGRAKRKGTPFTITKADIVIPEFCPALGIPLHRGARGDCDNAPSVDRVDNALGYTPDNVRVISRRANTLKGDSTIEEMEAVVAYLQEKSVQANSISLN